MSHALKFAAFIPDPNLTFPDDYDDVPTPALQLEDGQNKHAAAAENLAQAITSQLTLKVVEGHLYHYDHATGRYALIPNVVRFLYQHLTPTQRKRFRTRDLEEAASRILYSDHLSATADNFNSDACSINLLNGVWSMPMNQIRPHDPTQLYTYCVNAEFLSSHKRFPLSHPVFDEFCLTSLDGDPSKKQLLLEIIGAILSDFPVKGAFFLLGESSSGKSVLLSFLIRLLGRNLVSSVPLHLLGSRFNRAELWGKKANVVGEIKGNKLTDITTFKELTNQDLIQAERKGQDPFTFIPRAKLVFAGNVLPDVSESDATDAFANRLVPLIFAHSIPVEEQDPELKEKLWAERNAIVTEALLAFSSWVKSGRKWIFPSDSVKLINRFRKTAKPEIMFREECCSLDPDGAVCRSVLYSAYSHWCMVNGYSAVGRNLFYSSIDAIPDVNRARLSTPVGKVNRPHGWTGIALNWEVGHN